LSGIVRCTISTTALPAVCWGYGLRSSSICAGVCPFSSSRSERAPLLSNSFIASTLPLRAAKCIGVQLAHSDSILAPVRVSLGSRSLTSAPCCIRRRMVSWYRGAQTMQLRVMRLSQQRRHRVATATRSREDHTTWQRETKERTRSPCLPLVLDPHHAEEVPELLRACLSSGPDRVAVCHDRG